MDNKPRHHGNLKEALIDAGISLLHDEGITGLTLRKCAAIAGVSHAAPAHHFKGLDGLIGAIAKRGFDNFTRYMKEDRDSAGTNPAAQLKGILAGYLRFAKDHPALFTLMFGTRIDAIPDAELSDSAGAAYQVLSETCAPFVAPDDPNPRATELLVWSLCHGYAQLRLFGQGSPEGPAEEILLEDLLKRLPQLAKGFDESEQS